MLSAWLSSALPTSCGFSGGLGSLPRGGPCLALRRGGSSLSAMRDWPLHAPGLENSLVRELREDSSAKPTSLSREVLGAHYVRVRPSVPAPNPSLVTYSPETAGLLGLTPEQCESEEFLRTAAGSLPEAADCWATAYGASFAGRYGGQRGDGRAISIGQINGFEIQLKGAGVTPFSRQFDGRAVLRSSVREFLASEAMHYLRVPTTRALCVVESGDRVRRAWYDSDGRESLTLEPGAVGVRISPSFLRFGQFELFFQRDETTLLQELAQHALNRDFAHLRLQAPSAPFSQLVVEMFREVCERQAILVAGWMRVGYCQGNMNSDNSALCGVTLDYGPFAFMERFNPIFCPWVGGGMEYSFGRQPQAIAINLTILAEAFAAVLQDAATREKLPKAELDGELDRLRAGVSEVYVNTFHSIHDEDCRSKLGLAKWDDEAEELWSQLFGLMSGRCGGDGIDFTIFFRSLGDLEPPGTEDGAANSLAAVRAAAIGGMDGWPSEHVTAWKEWTGRYWARVAKEERASGAGLEARRREMARVNPKYILRNWMAVEAYEAAARGDSSVIDDIMRVLRRPYDDVPEADERFSKPTPDWARGKPGIAFMS